MNKDFLNIIMCECVYGDVYTYVYICMYVCIRVVTLGINVRVCVFYYDISIYMLRAHQDHFRPYLNSE